ncbi:hypothetical protein ESCO_004315 [Escovopsis weberi]|uniref:Uncharacterized protein n=1 Tax=Escovopsis weberi TaxID=150374 RepID=A0A0M9VV93_ESCWE|nr:hypothetical protein ESCO_004315 [Escovopsis weberi]
MSNTVSASTIPGQAGSIGFVAAPGQNRTLTPEDMGRIRRGMVIATPSRHMLEAGISLQAASGFTASFKDQALPGF